MAPNRGIVALVALVVLVWSVAFAGGATVAVLSAGVDVTTTFETPAELSEIDEGLTAESAGIGLAAVDVDNETEGTDGNETDPTVNAVEPGENVSAPTDGNASVPTDGNASVPTGGNVSAPGVDDASMTADGNASDPGADDVNTGVSPAAPLADEGGSDPADGNASSPETSPTPDENAPNASGTAPDPSEGAGESESTDEGSAGESSTDESESADEESGSDVEASESVGPENGA